MTEPQTPDWVRDAIFYQIFPDRFARSLTVPKPRHLDEWGAPPTYHGYQGGDLIGVVEQLDYLVDLGVNAIYFTPIFQSASNHRYHTHDYEKVDPMLGGNAALRRLIDEAHARGIRVVLDGVFNHASRGFFQFHDILENGPDSAYLDWFTVNEFPLNAYDGEKAPSYKAWWGLPALPKFNTDYPEVREFLWGIGRKWIEFGIDGWRLDVPNEIDDDAFWREFRRRVRAGNPEAYIVGEVWTDAAALAPGRHVGRGDELPVHPRLHRLLHRRARRPRASSRRTSLYPARPAPARQAFRTAIERLLGLYHPNVTAVHAEPAGQPRHGAVPHPGPRRPVGPAAGDPLPDDLSRRPVDLLRRRDRHDRRPRPGQPRRVPLARTETWDTELLHEFQRLIALRRQRPALRRGSFRFLHAAGRRHRLRPAARRRDGRRRDQRRAIDRGGSTCRSTAHLARRHRARRGLDRTAVRVEAG